MHLAKTNFNGNPNLGLYLFVTDSYCLAGMDIPDEEVKLVEKVLQVPVHRISIAGTSLIGVFLAGNNSTLLVPSIAFDYELLELDKLGLKYHVIQTKVTALGNSLLCNDSACVYSKEFEESAVAQIKKALDVPCELATLWNLNNVGSLAVLNDKGCLITRDADASEIKFIEDVFKLPCDIGTVNLGNPYIKSGLVTNKFGFLIGDLSGGPEIIHVDRVLGFLDR